MVGIGFALSTFKTYSNAFCEGYIVKFFKKLIFIFIIFIGLCFWVENLLDQKTGDVAASVDIEIGQSAPTDLVSFANEATLNTDERKNSMPLTTAFMLLGIGIIGLVTIGQYKS
jgi:hypothetical protein